MQQSSNLQRRNFPLKTQGCTKVLGVRFRRCNPALQNNFLVSYIIAILLFLGNTSFVALLEPKTNRDLLDRRSIHLSQVQFLSKILPFFREAISGS